MMLSTTIDQNRFRFTNI